VDAAPRQAENMSARTTPGPCAESSGSRLTIPGLNPKPRHDRNEYLGSTLAACENFDGVLDSSMMSIGLGG